MNPSQDTINLFSAAQQLQAFSFEEALKDLSTCQPFLVNMLAYYQIPKIFRQTHTTISKASVDKVLSFGKHAQAKNAEEFGFTKAQGNFYRVN